jgi:hypothetical protein
LYPKLIRWWEWRRYLNVTIRRYLEVIKKSSGMKRKYDKEKIKKIKNKIQFS